jgi:hypothetical protein
MAYHQERVDDFDEASEFDLVDSVVDDDDEDDPEAPAVGDERAVPEEAAEADVADQAVEVPPEDDDEPFVG